MQVIPATVTEIALAVREPSCLNTVDWTKMQSQLKRFASLKKLRFKLCTGDTFRSRNLKLDVQKRVWMGLPELKASGVLW